MKYAVAALLSTSAAIQLRGGPDVYGPNGDNYSNESANYDLSRIGISVTEAGKGPQCTKGDWATVHWKGTLTDGRIVTDSHSEGWGYPKHFAVGNAEVFKCWDLALPQLHMGDHATVTCPSYYAWGGAYTMSPLGGEPIPLHSDVTFELEVQECARHPEEPRVGYNAQPHTTTMQPGRWFYLHSHTGAHEALNQVLTTRTEGGKQVLAVEHKVVDEPEQMWMWDISDGSLHNQAHPEMFVDWSNGSHGLFLAPKGGASQGGFDYSANDQFFAGNHNPLTINHEDYTVQTSGNFGENDQFWHIEYCYNIVQPYVSEDGLDH
eukprot:CAMPEP_0170479236 /NCGR_PEP_ID=MMETSP0208-20121228/545_1 /TAXON_ID=197538 /ORGANISM="Strombidium inclinatum, Strain S3" /LENGTH=319 /DNA_ID=CAMNT_0010751595 /DNA_START=8 /DNA_END=967 /DNA_ORIENTATION=+